MKSEEADWESALDEPPQRRGMPRWVLYSCGCGCLVTGLIAVLALVLGFRFLEKATDPEVQWPKLAELLPYDEVPYDLELEAGIELFSAMEQYQLVDAEAGFTATVMRLEVATAKDIDALMTPGGQGALFGLGEPVGARAGELEIQGRVVRTLSFRKTKVPFLGDKLGPGLRVDLSAAGAGAVIVEFRRPDSREPFRDQEILEFFDYFDIWRGR